MEDIVHGFSVALSLQNLLFCFLGVFLGTFMGVLPGIGALSSVSLLLPVTFYLEPTTGLILLAGVYYGAEYGGSTASILLNLPGTPSNAVTCVDGHPMAKSGRAGIALLVATVGSFIGGSIGILILMFMMPAMISLALSLGSPEYFALMLFGLLAAGATGGSSPVKGMAMVILGLLFGTVGTDMGSGVVRYNFGFLELVDGIHLVVIAMGLFGVAEMIASIGTVRSGTMEAVKLRSMLPTKDEVRRSVLPILRGSGVGSLFGPLPGTGATMSAFMSYALEKRIARQPGRFGKGAIEGVAAPEAANNASAQTAFIPTLGLGIPGSATMALILGALMIHGISPGPTLISQHRDLFWGVVASFWIGNLLLLIINIPLIGLWVSVLRIPYKFLYPSIIVLVCIGVYSVNTSVFDVWLVLLMGVLGYGMRVLEFPAAPLMMGFILGPLMEQSLRRSLFLVRGDFLALLQRPGTAIILTITAVTVVVLLWSSYRSARQRRSRTGRDHSDRLAAGEPGRLDDDLDDRTDRISARSRI